MKVAIIGAGPAGITAAYCLSKNNISVSVFESNSCVGGMAKSIQLWNQKVDLGPHRFFSSDTRVNKLWLEVVGRDYVMIDRLTRIYYGGKYFYYPLKPLDALTKLGIFNSLACIMSYAYQKIKPIKLDGTFESWVVNRFGWRLYEIFFKTYSEKLWGITCKELDADFAAQRIKKLNLWEAIKNSIFGSKDKKHKTLVDEFAYPTGGSGMVYERMASYVNAHNGNIHLNTPVKRVLFEKGRAISIELEGGRIEHYDHIVSSMPLTNMISGLNDIPDTIRNIVKTLFYRNTILVYLHINGTGLFPDNWLYVHSSNITMGRITNFRNWVPDLYGNSENTILALEYWCYDKDIIWMKKDDELINMGAEELIKTGLIKYNKIIEGYVHRIKKCYPVYYKGYKDNLIPAINYIKNIKGLTLIGRAGCYKYNNQDHSILMGMLAAENIANGTHHDLWQINTDYETYQESSRISKTGLLIND